MYSDEVETTSQVVSTDQAVDDSFRKMEKQIRKYFSTQQSGAGSRKKRRGNKISLHPTSGSKYGSASTTFASDELVFDPNLLVDPLNSPDGNDPRLCRIGTGPIFTLSEASGGPQGLYIISQALSPEQQFAWASTALTQYSSTEYTNLTNLKYLREQQSTFGGRVVSAPKPIPENAKSADESSISVIDDSDTFWLRSLRENNNLKSFRELRW